MASEDYEDSKEEEQGEGEAGDGTASAAKDARRLKRSVYDFVST
jgi:hypothetical protein